MPVWLRNFIFKSMNEYYEKEKQEIENAQKGNKVNQHNSKRPMGPDIKKPTYTTKARK